MFSAGIPSPDLAGIGIVARPAPELLALLVGFTRRALPTSIVGRDCCAKASQAFIAAIRVMIDTFFARWRDMAFPGMNKSG